jgi:hypothetical protein
MCFRICIDSGSVWDLSKTYERKLLMKELLNISTIEKIESRSNLLKFIIFPFITLKIEIKQEIFSIGIEKEISFEFVMLNRSDKTEKRILFTSKTLLLILI